MLHDLTVVIHSIEGLAVGPKDKVQLQWGYLHEVGSTEVTRVNLRGVAVFKYRIHIWHVRKEDATTDNVALHICLQHIPYESRLPRPLEKLSLHLSLVHPITGRMGIASAKGLLFNLELVAPRRTSPPTSVIVESKTERRAAVAETAEASEMHTSRVLERRARRNSLEGGELGQFHLPDELTIDIAAPDVIITQPDEPDSTRSRRRGSGSPGFPSQDSVAATPSRKRSPSNVPALAFLPQDSSDLSPTWKRGGSISLLESQRSTSVYGASTEGCSVASSPLKSRVPSRRPSSSEAFPTRNVQQQRE
eukprot:EG_transcript_20838